MSSAKEIVSVLVDGVDWPTSVQPRLKGHALVAGHEPSLPVHGQEERIQRGGLPHAVLCGNDGKARFSSVQRRVMVAGIPLEVGNGQLGEANHDHVPLHIRLANERVAA